MYTKGVAETPPEVIFTKSHRAQRRPHRRPHSWPHRSLTEAPREGQDFYFFPQLDRSWLVGLQKFLKIPLIFSGKKKNKIFYFFFSGFLFFFSHPRNLGWLVYRDYFFSKTCGVQKKKNKTSIA